MLARPGLLFGYQSDAYWLDIGTPEKYLQAHEDLLDGRVGKAPARDARQISPGIWVQGNGMIDAGAVVGPPVLVGDGARIEAGARVRRSVVGSGAVVESGAELDGAVLHAGARASRDSSVRNSVVGSDAVLSPDVTLAADTVVGAGVTVVTGTRISGGRVPPDRE
jgi:NDP-sugar pyrophosphorylase family protein